MPSLPESELPESELPESEGSISGQEPTIEPIEALTEEDKNKFPTILSKFENPSPEELKAIIAVSSALSGQERVIKLYSEGSSDRSSIIVRSNDKQYSLEEEALFERLVGATLRIIRQGSGIAPEILSNLTQNHEVLAAFKNYCATSHRFVSYYEKNVENQLIGALLKATGVVLEKEVEEELKGWRPINRYLVPLSQFPLIESEIIEDCSDRESKDRQRATELALRSDSAAAHAVVISSITDRPPVIRSKDRRSFAHDSFQHDAVMIRIFLKAYKKFIEFSVSAGDRNLLIKDMLALLQAYEEGKYAKIVKVERKENILDVRNLQEVKKSLEKLLITALTSPDVDVANKAEGLITSFISNSSETQSQDGPAVLKPMKLRFLPFGALKEITPQSHSDAFERLGRLAFGTEEGGKKLKELVEARKAAIGPHSEHSDEWRQQCNQFLFDRMHEMLPSLDGDNPDSFENQLFLELVWRVESDDSKEDEFPTELRELLNLAKVPNLPAGDKGSIFWKVLSEYEHSKAEELQFLVPAIMEMIASFNEGEKPELGTDTHETLNFDNFLGGMRDFLEDNHQARNCFTIDQMETIIDFLIKTNKQIKGVLDSSKTDSTEGRSDTQQVLKRIVDEIDPFLKYFEKHLPDRKIQENLSNLSNYCKWLQDEAVKLASSKEAANTDVEYRLKGFSSVDDANSVFDLLSMLFNIWISKEGMPGYSLLSEAIRLMPESVFQDIIGREDSRFIRFMRRKRSD